MLVIKLSIRGWGETEPQAIAGNSHDVIFPYTTGQNSRLFPIKADVLATPNPGKTQPSADFVSPDINFQTNDSSSTPVSTFLNGPSFFNTASGFDPNRQTDNLFLEIVAQTYLNVGSNSFVVGHDDGVVLAFSDSSIGTVVNAPGPTGFSNSPFSVTGASSGLYSFDLKYTECFGGPADLVFTINSAPVGVLTPEPSSLALFGAGFGAVVLLTRRYRRE